MWLSKKRIKYVLVELMKFKVNDAKNTLKYIFKAIISQIKLFLAVFVFFLLILGLKYSDADFFAKFSTKFFQEKDWQEFYGWSQAITGTKTQGKKGKHNTHRYATHRYDIF